MFRRLGPQDRGALEQFLASSPAINSLATGLLSRYGFDGPAQFYAAPPPPAQIACIVTMDRGRVLMLGEASSSAEAAAGDLLLDRNLRHAMGPTALIDAVLQSSSRLGQSWRHQPQQVEQQMALIQADYRPAAVPDGLDIAEIAPADCAAVAATLRHAPGWEGASPASLSHRLERGSLFVATRQQAVVGALWANAIPASHPRLSRLWVSPEHRGMGIAVALTAAAADRLLAGGAQQVLSWVQQRDQRARQVLSRVGFGPLALWKKVLLSHDAAAARSTVRH